jgi:hypothetical protein
VSTVMLKTRSAATALARRLLAARTRAGRAVAAGWRRLRAVACPDRPPPVCVEALLYGRRERRAMQHALTGAVRQLRRVAAVPAPHTVAVIVQQSLPAATPGHPLAACTEVRSQPDGGRLALIRLAAEPGGYRLRPDDVLAALAEQWLALAADLAGGTRVLVPLELSALAEPALLPVPLAPLPSTPPARTGASPAGGPGANGQGPAVARR